MAGKAVKISAHARRRWQERGGTIPLKLAWEQAKPLPRHPARGPLEKAFSFEHWVLIVRNKVLVTVLEREFWEKSHVNQTWDGIPVRRQNERPVYDL